MAEKVDLGYPDMPLGEQLRPYEETLSVFDVLRDAFFLREATNG